MTLEAQIWHAIFIWNSNVHIKVQFTEKKKCFSSIFPAINVPNCSFNSSVNIWSCLYKQVKIKNFDLYKIFMMATLIIDTNRLSVTSDISDLTKSNSEYFDQVPFWLIRNFKYNVKRFKQIKVQNWEWLSVEGQTHVNLLSFKGTTFYWTFILKIFCMLSFETFFFIVFITFLMFIFVMFSIW